MHKFKEENKNVNFPTKFCLGSISIKVDYAQSEDLSLKGNADNDIISIQGYPVVKANRKQCFTLFLREYQINNQHS